MRKKILSLSLAAMSFVTFGAMAQNTSTASSDCQTPAACQAPAKCDKGPRCDKDRKGKACRQQPSPFDGLNLTADQQARLQQLDGKRKAAREQQAKERKADRQRTDSARIADRRASKKAYLEEVKEIIGPDRYVMFLENIVINGNGHRGHDKAAFDRARGDKASMGKAGKPFGKDKAHKGDRKGRHGHHAFNRADRPAPAASQSSTANS